MNNIWAVFDLESRSKYGGNYKKNYKANIPLKIANSFKSNNIR